MDYLQEMRKTWPDDWEATLKNQEQQQLAPLGIKIAATRDHRLKFVNRHQALYDLAYQVLHKPADSDDKTVLVVAGQLFGSGKTYLGLNFIAQLRQLRETKADDAKWKMLFEKAIFDDLLRSRTIRLDLIEVWQAAKTFAPQSEDSFYRLRSALWKKLCAELLPGWTPPVLHSSVTLQEMLGHLHDALERQPIFLVLDEMGMVEKLTDLPVTETYSSGYLNEDQKTRLARYYSLWQEILPLLKHKKVFVFACGKQELLSMAGLGLLGTNTSPGLLHALFLDTFEKDHIKEIMLNTPVIAANGSYQSTSVCCLLHLLALVLLLTMWHRFAKHSAQMKTLQSINWRQQFRSRLQVYHVLYRQC